MREFVMVPRSLIYNIKLNEKRVLAYSSILFSEWGGENIEELVSYSRFSTRRHFDGVVSQYQDLVHQFIEKNYFKKGKSHLIYVKQPDSFGIIYYDEFQRILQAKDAGVQNGQRINHSHILLLLSHIRLCMIRQPGKPLFYSNLLNRISNSTGLSVRSITKSLKILEELNIIHSEELPRYKDSDGQWHSNVKIFVNIQDKDANYNWQDEVVRGIKYIMINQMDYGG